MGQYRNQHELCAAWAAGQLPDGFGSCRTATVLNDQLRYTGRGRGFGTIVAARDQTGHLWIVQQHGNAWGGTHKLASKVWRALWSSSNTSGRCTHVTALCWDAQGRFDRLATQRTHYRAQVAEFERQVERAPRLRKVNRLYIWKYLADTWHALWALAAQVDEPLPALADATRLAMLDAQITDGS